LFLWVSGAKKMVETLLRGNDEVREKKKKTKPNTFSFFDEYSCLIVKKSFLVFFGRTNPPPPHPRHSKRSGLLSARLTTKPSLL